jgi:hypothetical protein
MATSNYYGLTGVGSNIKFGKSGGHVSYDSLNNSFNLKQNDDLTYAGLAVNKLDVTTGDISLISSTSKLSINGATLQWQSSDVLRFGGAAAVMIPSGNNASRPVTGLVGMIRINTQSSVRIEYFDGTTWQVPGGNALQLTGGQMTGDIEMTNGSKLTGLPTPVVSSDAVNKDYVDNLVEGLSWKQAVSVLSTTNVNVNSPSSASIGGATLSTGSRVLLTNQTDNSQNGIWIFNGVGLPMNRSSDANTPTELNGAAVFVLVGTRADTGWTQTATLNASFAGQVWAQFTSGTAYTAGSGLTLNGNQFNVNIGLGLTITTDSLVPNGLVSINPQAGTALQINEQNELTLKLETGGGLLQSVDGLKIADNQVTNAMLAGNIENSKLQNSAIVVTDGITTENVDLGESLSIVGQGPVQSSLSSGTISVSVATATTTSTGVASFNTSNFDVTSGDVTVKAIDAGIF